MEILLFSVILIIGVLFFIFVISDPDTYGWLQLPAIICIALTIIGGLYITDNLYAEGEVIKFRGENNEIIQDTTQDIYFYFPNADTLINKKDLLK